MDDLRAAANTSAPDEFWGTVGAGALFYAEDTGRVCVQKRSGLVNEPGTWGTWGGAVDASESIPKGLRRELHEETGYGGSLQLKRVSIYRNRDFRYHNFLAIVPTEFEPRHSWETTDHAWVLIDALPHPLHYGLRAALPAFAIAISRRRRTAMEHATQDALQKYLHEHPKANKKNHKVVKSPQQSSSTKSEEPKPAPAPVRTELKGIFKPSAEAVATVLNDNKSHFDEVDKDCTKESESFESKRDPTYGNDDEIEHTDFMAELYPKWSLAAKRLHVAGHKIGEHFEKSLSRAEKKLHDNYFERWRTAAGAYDHKGNGDPDDIDFSSQELQGIAASLGVHGTFDPNDKEIEQATKGGVTAARNKAAKNPKLQAYVKKMYAYQQAYLKNAGIKELTLYGAVKDPKADTQPPGIKVQIDSRELSSFTADPNVAKKFGRLIEYKIPADRILACSLVRPGIGSETCPDAIFKEAEFIVMGVSDLEGHTFGKPVKRTAAEAKSIRLPITRDNADWLQLGHRREKKKAAARVLRRWVRGYSQSV